MRYNLDTTDEAHRAFSYLNKLVCKHARVDIKKVDPKRSLNQNAYLHLTFGIFAVQYGEPSRIAVKQIHYKKYANPDLYIAKSKDGDLFLRSSADLTTTEMTKSIDRWRVYAGECGVHIPLPGDDEALIYWQNRIEQNEFI